MRPIRRGVGPGDRVGAADAEERADGRRVPEAGAVVVLDMHQAHCCCRLSGASVEKFLAGLVAGRHAEQRQRGLRVRCFGNHPGERHAAGHVDHDEDPEAGPDVLLEGFQRRLLFGREQLPRAHLLGGQNERHLAFVDLDELAHHERAQVRAAPPALVPRVVLALGRNRNAGRRQKTLQMFAQSAVGREYQRGKFISDPLLVRQMDLCLEIFPDIRDGRTLEVEADLLPDLGHHIPKDLADPLGAIALEMIEGDEGVLGGFTGLEALEDVEVLLQGATLVDGKARLFAASRHRRADGRAKHRCRELSDELLGLGRVEHSLGKPKLGIAALHPQLGAIGGRSLAKHEVKPAEFALLLRQRLGCRESAEPLREAPACRRERGVDPRTGQLQVLGEDRVGDDGGNAVVAADDLVAFRAGATDDERPLVEGDLRLGEELVAGDDGHAATSTREYSQRTLSRLARSCPRAISRWQAAKARGWETGACGKRSFM